MKVESEKFRIISRLWYIKYPGNVYAHGPVEFKKPVRQRAVREYMREWLGVKHLPMGSECWPTK